MFTLPARDLAPKPPPPPAEPEPVRRGFARPDNGSGDDYFPASEPNYQPGQGVVRSGSTGPGAGTPGLFGGLANFGRGLVPQGVRDVAGAVGQGAKDYAGEMLGGLSSGVRYPLNTFAFSPYESGWGDITERSSAQTTPGRLAFAALDVATAPATIGSAAIGGPGSAEAIRRLPLIARAPLNVALPASRSANFGTRLAAETAIGTAATVGAQETAERTDNPWLVGAAGLGAGVLASGAVSAAPRVGRGVKEAAQAAASPGPLRPGEASPRAMLIPGVGDVPERIPMGEITPYDVRGTLADISDLTKRADALRSKIAKNPNNRAAMRELGEAEAMITLRHAAIDAGSDPEEMLRAIERAAQQVSEYTARSAAPKGGRMVAPAFGSPERAAYEADIKAFRAPKQRGGAVSRRATGAPFDGPMQAVRDYEDTLVRMLGGELGDLVRKSSPLEIARTKILDATKREAQLRNSGVVDLEIGSGRSRQVAGIRSGLEAAQDLGGAEMIRQARAGAKVGQMRTVLAEAIDLSDDEVGAIITETMRRQPSAFSALQMGDIIDRLREGRGLQPAQINTVRDVLGKDVAESLSLRPASAEPRNITPAMIQRMQDELRAAEEAAPERAAREQTKANVREVNARMRALGEQAPPPPKPSDTAFERAALDPKAKWNEAQAADIRRARKQVEAWQKGQAQIQAEAAREMRKQVDDLERMSRLNARAVDAADKRELKGAAKVLRDAQREEERAGQVAARESRIAARAQKGYPTPDEILRQVDAADITPEGREIARQWVEGNRILLDRVETGGIFEPLRQISATLKGDVRDSYLNAVLVRESLLSDTLMKAGVSDKVAKQVARALSERELLMKYGVSAVESLPDDVVSTLKGARTVAFEDQLGGLVKLNQEAKATMFGLADIGIFGQQVHTAVMNGGIPGMVGLLNRTAGLLHLPHVSTMLADSTLPRQLQYGIDGLDTGIASSGLTKGSGTLLRRVPKVGESLDAVITRVVDKYSEWQFGTVMGSVRNLMYEGNLALAKATGSDIADPLVRAQAANAANHITSSARLATNATRRQLESVAFTSAQMNRARFARINDMAKLLSPKATKEERLFAATVITSNVVSSVLLGKLVHDAVGVGEFEADPSKPGFGKITLNRKDEQGRNIVWDYIPQDSIQRAFGQSLRALAEGSPEDAAKAWARAGIGAASPVSRLPLAGAGLSYTPGSGYGYIQDRATPTERLKGMVPVPPIASALMRGETEPYQIGSQVIAEGMYPESPSEATKRPEFNYSTLRGEAQFDAIKPQAWRQIATSGVPAFAAAAKYENVYEYTQEFRETVAPQLAAMKKPDGTPKYDPAEIPDKAQAMLEAQPVYKAYLDARDQYRTQWLIDNPAEAVKRWREDSTKRWDDPTKWNPTKRQETIMLNWLKAKGE